MSDSICRNSTMRDWNIRTYISILDYRVHGFYRCLYRWYDSSDLELLIYYKNMSLQELSLNICSVETSSISNSQQKIMLPSIFSNQITAMAFSDAWANRLFAVKQGTTVSTNHIYVLLLVRLELCRATMGRLITPAISAPNATKFYETFVK